MWLTMAAAGFFALLVLITLLRAEKSVANVALTVITLLSIGVAAAANIRGFGLGGEAGSPDRPSSPSVTTASLPALACIDDLAGDTVLAACEKVLFASADSTAAAVSYAASRITRLTSFGDLATAKANLTPELESLRRAVERDRYGLMAYVLVARDQCTAAACPAFRSVINSRQIASNMDERVYEGLVLRYSGSWNAPPPAATAAAVPGMVATLPPGVPTGRPTNAEFPSASSTPAVSIMMPEPSANSARAAAPPSTRPAAAAPAAQAPPAKEAAAPPAPKKQAPPKAARAPTQAPTQLTPPSSPPAPQAPAADNE